MDPTRIVKNVFPREKNALKILITTETRFRINITFENPERTFYKFSIFNFIFNFLKKKTLGKTGFSKINPNFPENFRANIYVRAREGRLKIDPLPVGK